jgi:hypothetical protein
MIIFAVISLAIAERIVEKIAQFPDNYTLNWHGGYLNDNKVYY